jgi:hypothetical protein
MAPVDDRREPDLFADIHALLRMMRWSDLLTDLLPGVFAAGYSESVECGCGDRCFSELSANLISMLIRRSKSAYRWAEAQPRRRNGFHHTFTL